MKTILAATGRAAVLLLPTGVVAKPDKAEKEAAAQCKTERVRRPAAERSHIGRAAFAEKYGTNRNGRNAFGRCVSRRAEGV
jgi:hypothetical protein